MRKNFLLMAACCALLVTLCFAQTVSAYTLAGKLRTRGNQRVRMNGNSAGAGTTVLDGAHVQTPAGVGATIDLGPLGRLDIAPQTELTLRFTADTVGVALKSGYVVLTTRKGVRGTVTTADGKTFATDASKLSSVIAHTAENMGPEASAPVSAGGGIGGGAAAGVGVAAGAAAIGAGVARGHGRGRNLSPTTPRGNQ